MTAIKDETPLPEENKEESTLEESFISDEKHMFELKIKEGEEGISGDHHANGNCVERWFQVSVRLDQCCFFFTLIYIYNP